MYHKSRRRRQRFVPEFYDDDEIEQPVIEMTETAEIPAAEDSAESKIGRAHV